MSSAVAFTSHQGVLQPPAQRLAAIKPAGASIRIRQKGGRSGCQDSSRSVLFSSGCGGAATALTCSSLKSRSRRCRCKSKRHVAVARSAVVEVEPPAAAVSTAGMSPRTEAFLRSAVSTPGAPGKGGDATVEGVRRANEMWRRIRQRAREFEEGQAPPKAPQIVERLKGMKAASAPPKEALVADVVVCGGTLGIFVATALQNAGLQVCVVERGLVKGRDQEWNLNRDELRPLVLEGVVSESDIEAAVTSEWPASRVGVRGEHAMEFEAAALNAGVSPAILVEAARARFEANGGKVLEKASLKAVKVYDDAALVEADDGRVVQSRLVIDAMGAASPIVAQARDNAPPDAACLVVGTMASGFPQEQNQTGDYLYSIGPMTQRGYQPFWESFPAASGGESGTDRTTYYFAYALPSATDLPDVTDILEDYIDALPKYQGVEIDDLTVQRVLAATFVAYRDSPLGSRFDRLVQVGDAAGIQSPLSFGGFGALCRHLARVRAGVVEALEAEAMSKEDLALLNPYMPNLSLQWAMYRSIAQPPPTEPEFVNRVLGGMLNSASTCGKEVLIPILQDVFSLRSLGVTLLSWFQRDPLVIPGLLTSMGPANVGAALGSFAGLAWYTVLTSVVVPVVNPIAESLPPKDRFRWRRSVEAWRYGSGLDFEHEH
mmetsp:Transcript_11595/g.27021  ORF Transcript_11595/g.27021 Transcript_11595/m.27021 type:complete len:660 (-) Transcript_11595:82-2061(-)